MFRVSLNLFRVVLFRVSLLRVGGVVSLLHVDPSCVLRGCVVVVVAGTHEARMTQTTTSFPLKETSQTTTPYR